MRIEEVVQIIDNEKRKRDFRQEMTTANSMLYRQNGEGTFEAVLTNRGDEKCLIPEVGTLHYLFRGQNEEVKPCIPSLYRGNPTDLDIFVERMRLVVFKRLLASHPVIKGFFRKHNFKVDVEGLAQHYGLKTSVLDLTSNLDVALFFATCWFNKDTGDYYYYDDGKEHNAILYVFHPLLDNEPNPSTNEENYMNHNITPIGLQAFPRPGEQQGYALHIAKGNSTKSWIYRFTFSCKDSKYYYDLFKKKKFMRVKEDKLISKVANIASQTIFSFDVFNEAFKDYRPKGFSKTKLKAALSREVSFNNKLTDLVFSSIENNDIVNDWNNHTGTKTASMIRRKPWFEYDEITEGSGNDKDSIKGKKNESNYRTLKQISIQQMLFYMGAPEPPQAAEWVNYRNMPRPKELYNKSSEGWKKVPASMENVFGQEYLSEEDWKI